MRPREASLLAVHWPAPFHRACHRRYVDHVAVVADSHPRLLRPVDAVDLLQEPMHEVDARLLAVGDDVEARVFLLLEPDQRRVALGGLQLLAVKTPRRPKLLGFGEPGGLGEAACNRRPEHAPTPA